MEAMLASQGHLAPFELYPLYRRQAVEMKGGAAEMGYHKMRTGTFKGTISVRRAPRGDDDEGATTATAADLEAAGAGGSDRIDFEKLLKPKPCCVRIYVLNAQHLVPHDRDTHKADPYLRIKCAGQPENPICEK